MTTDKATVDDSGPAYPEPFIYLVNSMADDRELHLMARKFAEQVKSMPKGLSVRDWLVGQALAGGASYVAKWRTDSRREQVGIVVSAAEAIADEYLSRRKKNCPEDKDA